MCAYIASQAQRYPDLDLQPLAIPPGVVRDPRDEALAHQIAQQVIARWITLGYLCQQFLKSAWNNTQPELKAALLVGSAQILLLDRVPAYAAVDHAVGWARQSLRAGASKVVNAVLRRIAELVDESGATVDYVDRQDQVPLSSGAARPLRQPLLPSDRAERLAMSTGHPRKVIERWIAQHGPDAAHDLALHSLCEPPTIFNTSFARTPLPLALQPHSEPGHHDFNGTRQELLEIVDTRHDLWVQDPASSRAIRDAAKALASAGAGAGAGAGAASPRQIVDLCAGLGTKTRQLAATFPGANIIATDPDERRFALLQELFAGHPRVRALPTAQVLAEQQGRADLILLDVPCSNSGVLARRPEAKYRLSDANLAKLGKVQRDILTRAAGLLAPSGSILYSTCSLEPVENEDQVGWACKTLGLVARGPGTLLPAGAPGGPPTQYHDGAFSALLRRQ